jgi:nicotinate phosphoribosyltransferase
MHSDMLTLVDDASAGSPLLEPVMRGGRRLPAASSLAHARLRAEEQLARLPGPLRQLDAARPYPVHVSEALRRLADEVDRLQVG